MHNSHKRSWLACEYWATDESLEVALCAFNEADALGIDTDDGIDPNGTCRYEMGRAKVTAYFDQRTGLMHELQVLLDHFFDECGFDAPELSFRQVMEEDWQQNFVNSCSTFVVKPGITIVPSFEMEAFKKTDPKGLYIEMDPENAFGTGQHQSTKLCLKLIHEVLISHDPKRLKELKGLDVGSGSGILAILMKKMGAGEVWASDIDSRALLTAQKNFEKNQVEVTPLAVDPGHSYEREGFHLVAANILAPVLMDMANTLRCCLTRDGLLLLSGILLQQSQKVIDVFTLLGLTLLRQESMDDWQALLFRSVENPTSVDGKPAGLGAMMLRDPFHGSPARE